MESVRKNNISQSQKMMIFMLAMSLYGLATLFSELIPSFQLGIFELSVEYFFFIPLTLAMLFDPLSVALGAATGEVVFSEIMLGQFGGLGELEKFLTVTFGIYIAGRLVKDAKNKKMVGIAAMVGTAIQLAMGSLVDVLKVVFAVDDMDTIAGLPESVLVVEGFSFLNDLLFSGILFCLLPTLYLVPKLYGKIEPLLGMKPRDEKTIIGDENPVSVKVIFAGVIAFVVATAAEFLAESDMSLIDWEADWAESTPAMATGFVVSALVAVVVIVLLVKRAKSPLSSRNQ
jgi:hypothetical protein